MLKLAATRVAVIALVENLLPIPSRERLVELGLVDDLTGRELRDVRRAYARYALRTIGKLSTALGEANVTSTIAVLERVAKTGE